MPCAAAVAGCHDHRVHRNIDPAPIESTTAELAPGIFEAGFALDTGGDQMSSRPVDAGLVVRVAFGSRLFRQEFASCKGGGYGDELSDGSSAIDWAECDGTTYSLRFADARIEVRDESSHRLVTAISLPPGLHLATHR